jgi:hypothetical protein
MNVNGYEIEPGANLHSANLAGANLTGADLSCANLTGANLTGANLNYAHLHTANLAGANLTNARLFQANLTGANMTGANLPKADLSDANLTGANLTGANLTGATMFPGDLNGANLSSTTMPDGRIQKTWKTSSSSYTPTQTSRNTPSTGTGSPGARSKVANALEIFKTQADACAEAVKMVRPTEIRMAFMSRAEIDEVVRQLEQIHAEAARLYENALGMGSGMAHVNAVDNAFANFRKVAFDNK